MSQELGVNVAMFASLLGHKSNVYNLKSFLSGYECWYTKISQTKKNERDDSYSKAI